MEVEVKVEKEKKKEYGKWDKWEIEDAARTLKEAEKIKQDPEKMKYVMECIKKEKKAISSIEDLRTRYSEMQDDD